MYARKVSLHLNSESPTQVLQKVEHAVTPLLRKQKGFLDQLILVSDSGKIIVRDYLLPLYRKYAKEAELRVELFDCAHMELPEMRKLILEWMERCLVAAPRN